MGETPLRIKLRRAGHKMVRLDQAVDDGTAGEPKADDAGRGGSLLGLLFKAIRSGPEPADRRRELRHPAAAREVWVGWWRGEDFGAVRGRITNISRGGAHVLVDSRPPRKTSVWLFKDVGSTLAHVRA
ncbi:MAG: hypothetical protein LC745_06170, partial [Planctomycetia bacterium]|nr:hypothetical protein [Planctomycetia bacterium]